MKNNLLFMTFLLTSILSSCKQEPKPDPAIELGRTNAEMTSKVHDLFSKNQFDECTKYATPNVQIVAHSMGASFNGQEEFLNFMAGFKQAFPDMVITHNNILGIGEKVAVEFTAIGTHTGPLQTPNGAIPASGKKVELKVSEFWEWKDGKISKITNYQDAVSLLRQIGAM
ncbi:MAG: SnoaL-like domain-containing protein [Saprospiraceae bacterium]|nr:SnoaL-like domain-containing protein [Saprospiraceae bacterium]